MDYDDLYTQAEQHGIYAALANDTTTEPTTDDFSPADFLDDIDIYNHYLENGSLIHLYDGTYLSPEEEEQLSLYKEDLIAYCEWMTGDDEAWAEIARELRLTEE